MSEKRTVAHQMQMAGYPLTMVCKVLDLARSTYYYQPVPGDEKELGAAITALVGEFPCYGTRRITHQLRRPPYQMQVNRKRVRRTMAAQKQLSAPKQRKKRTTDSNHPYPRYRNLVMNLPITAPDQVWVSDVTYIRLRHNFVYLAIIMDVFTRALRGWGLRRTLDQELTLAALRSALATHQPEIHHSDQGNVYAAKAYIQMLRAHDIRISMAAVGKPEENGYAERVIRTIKEEEVDLSEYLSFTDASQQIGYFIDQVYMTKRIHSALGYLTPSEFESALAPP